LPGRKQIFREEADGIAVRDVIARMEEQLPGRVLLRPVMRNGRRLPAGEVTLDEIRRHAGEQLAALPPGVRSLAPADPSYPVEISLELAVLNRRVAGTVAAADGGMER
jgi:nicotinate phosphoribosyltransferase